jgi:hypothetical protein
VSFLLLLLGLLPAIGLAVWACMSTWRGNWKLAGAVLGAPLLLALLVAALALSGALDSDRSEDWGPLMALLFAVPVAAFFGAAAIVASIVGYLGQRRRTAALESTF